MNIHFDPEDLRSIFMEVIKKEFKTNIESMLSNMCLNFIDEALHKTKETIAERLSKLCELNEEVKHTLVRLNSQCGRLSAELTSVSDCGRSSEDAVGLVEETTLPQLLEEACFEVKTMRAVIEGMRAEMQSTGEVVNKISHPVPIASSLPLESTAMEVLPADQVEQVSLSTEEFLLSLPQPSKGDTFNGMSIEMISTEVKGPDALTVEIVNYLDMPLENFRLYLPNGKECMRAPESIRSQTREVFTFCGGFPHEYTFPEGVFSYFVGGTNAAIHAYFHFYVAARFFDPDTRIALGFLQTAESEQAIYRPGEDYIHKGEPGSFKYLETDSLDAVIMVNDNDLYARASFNEDKKGILTIDVFQRKP